MAGIPSEDAAAPASDGLVSALRHVLRPLVRLLISRAVPYPLAASVLRALYVEIAVDEFPVPGKAQTDSRITLLTGVHRKDVKRLRAEPRDEHRPSKAASLGSQIIARWLSPAWATPDGAPKPLVRVARGRDRRSFESLVRSVNTDIRPRVFLDEWQRLGIVHVDDDDRVHLDVQGYVPAKASDEMTYFFGRNLHDHAAAAVSNMLGAAAPFFERSVHYTGLSREAVAELTEAARARGMEVLRELNAHALRLQERDGDRAEATHRWNAGLYLFSEDAPPSERKPRT